MLIAFWILLFLYASLTLFYLVSKPKQAEIKPWPILEPIKESRETKTFCNFHSDCPSTHVCLNKQCIPKLWKENRCNPATGNWISHIHQGVTFAICVCSEPRLMNQKFFGANCDIDVGCGIHGRYILESKTCECDSGYKSIGLTCQKAPVVDYINLNPCAEDELISNEIDTSYGFSENYINHTSPRLKCVKKPCSFDALTGRHLKHAKFEKDWGCVCDPKYGQFGVVLENMDDKYLNVQGFNACASIFTEDPQEPINVELITYFYLGKREPVSIIFFGNLNENKLTPFFKGTTNIMLSQRLWNYDYAQYFFKTNQKFRARTRRIEEYTIFRIENIKDKTCK